MSVAFTFTNKNTSVLINGKPLGGIFKIDVYQQLDEQKCSIMLRRHIVNSDELVNEMRSGREFTLKLVNNSFGSGYVAEAAKIKSFNMTLSVEDDGKELLLEQTITVIASSFLYFEDVRPFTKTAEEEDLKNLISILKENQAKAKPSVPAAVLPTDTHTCGVMCDGQDSDGCSKEAPLGNESGQIRGMASSITQFDDAQDFLKESDTKKEKKKKKNKK